MGTDGSDDQDEIRNELQAALARTVRKARLAADLTQEDMGDLIGVTSEFYARIERGHVLPSVPTLRKLAEVLAVEADVLLGLKGPPRRSRKTATGPRSGSRTGPRGGPEPPEEEDDEGYLTDTAELRKVARRLRKAHPDTLRLIDKLLKDVDRIIGSADDD